MTDMNNSKKKQKITRKIVSPLIAGLIAIFPLTITVIVVIWLVRLISDFLGPESTFGMLLQEIGLNFVSSPVVAYIIGLCCTIVAIFLLGVLVQTGLQKRINVLSDRIVSRIPFIKTIYDASRKIANLFETNDQPDIKAMSPVTCYFGGKGGTAVLALLTSKEIITMDGRDYYSIMIPTSPVPIGGAILYVPVEWVEKVNFSIDGLVNIYVSMGVTGPEYLNKKNTS